MSPLSGSHLSASTDLMDLIDTPDLKYPYNQKSTGDKSGDRGSYGNLKPLLVILSPPNVCIRNALTGVTTASCINVKVEYVSLSRKDEVIINLYYYIK